METCDDHERSNNKLSGYLLIENESLPCYSLDSLYIIYYTKAATFEYSKLLSNIKASEMGKIVRCHQIVESSVTNQKRK